MPQFWPRVGMGVLVDSMYVSSDPRIEDMYVLIQYQCNGNQECQQQQDCIQASGNV